MVGLILLGMAMGYGSVGSAVLLRRKLAGPMGAAERQRNKEIELRAAEYVSMGYSPSWSRDTARRDMVKEADGARGEIENTLSMESLKKRDGTPIAVDYSAARDHYLASIGAIGSALQRSIPKTPLQQVSEMEVIDLDAEGIETGTGKPVPWWTASWRYANPYLSLMD